MKKGMTFHYFFLFFILLRLIRGAFSIIFIPNHIQSLIINYQRMTDHIPFWWETLLNDAVMGIICILAIPLFYQLLNTVNLNLKKLKFFLWAYGLRQLLLNMMHSIFNATELTPAFFILWLCVEVPIIALLIQAILKYYQNRTHLFMTETKEARRSKYKALITHLTRGLISFER